MLYPLKFHPIFKDKIWGGEKIRTILKKDFAPLPNCGESWEISGYQDNESIVMNGYLKGKGLNEILNIHKDELVGQRVFEKYKTEFPLLIKFIDSNDDLSIQVHPNDELAMQRHNSFGKTEMWYIIHADENAELISGFNQQMDKETYLRNFNNGTLMDILNKEKVFKDDVFFIPAGRIHTLGKGLLLTEIQQSSDLTYRIYDFDRTDQFGRKRALHVKDALDAIDYTYYSEYKTKYTDQIDVPVEIVRSLYFTTNKILLNTRFERDIEILDSFVIYICLEGNGNIQYVGGNTSIKMGDVLLVPASLKRLTLVPDPNLKLLETYITV